MGAAEEYELVINDTRLLIILIRLGGVLIRSQVIHSSSSFFFFFFVLPFFSWEEVKFRDVQRMIWHSTSKAYLYIALEDPPGQNCVVYVGVRWR